MDYELIIRGGQVVLAGREPAQADIGVRDGRIAAIGDLQGSRADSELDARSMLVLPGAVDAHYHLGIYRGIAQDAASETLSSLAGGVTSVISYFRSGSHYLNRSGAYAELLPEVLEATSGHARTDYAYHLAPMDRRHIAEIPMLVERFGMRSFKYYMFYKGMDLAGVGAGQDERLSADLYDLGHLFEIMEAIAPLGADGPDRISLSIHAEQPELIRVFMERVRASGELRGLEAYSAARPPLTERLAIGEAGVLACATSCPINLLHLSSAEAIDAACELRRARRELDVRLEVTLHHLALSYETYSDQRGKVNPPIRAESDREALWAALVRGEIDWVCSDHACCSEHHKEGDMWAALPGFGGSALMYPYLLTEGPRRGLPIHRIVELAATNPARAYGLAPAKGQIAIGADADLAIIDMDATYEVTPARLLSAQEYTPFAGMRLTGWPRMTILRGELALRDGEPVGEPRGAYVHQRAAQRTLGQTSSVERT
jgi:dihydroorotase-like cyclic amidohydrolase